MQPPLSHQAPQFLTRRYLTDADYSADALTLAASGWRVVSVQRESDGAITANYAPTAVQPQLQPQPQPQSQEAYAGPPVPRMDRTRITERQQAHALLILGAILSGLVLLAVMGTLVNAALTGGAQATVRATTTPSASSAYATAYAATAQAMASQSTVTSAPAPILVTGARLGGPIFDFDARYGSDNPPGPSYQWFTTLAGQPVQLTVALSRDGDTLDNQTRAIIIDINSPTGSGAPWTAAEGAAIVKPFLPADATLIKNVAGSGNLGPDHIYMSQQLANSLAPSVFTLGTSTYTTPGTFDWQCSIQHPSCELGPGSNS